MDDQPRPYIGNCSFCGDGLLRFMRCESCHLIVAMCDECELMWQDIALVSEDANLSSDSAYPCCPFCGARHGSWSAPTAEEIEERDLRRYATGESV